MSLTGMSARLRADLELAEHDADLAAVDRALRLADELERDLGDDFLVRIDREQVDVRDLAAERVDLVLLDERVQRAAVAAPPSIVRSMTVFCLRTGSSAARSALTSTMIGSGSMRPSADAP